MGWFNWAGTAVSLGKKAWDWFKGSDKAQNTALGAISGIGGWLASKAGAKQQYKWQKEFMNDQYGYSTKLMKRQNKYITENAQDEARLNSYLMLQQQNAEKGLQASAYSYQNKLQNKQMQWEQMMSNTAHQREVSDLRQAGLNPILSANGGASTPSAGMGSIGIGSAGGASVSIGGPSGGSAGTGSAPNLDYAQQIQNAISNTFQDRELKQQAYGIYATANLQNAQAKTEENRRLNIDADTTLKNFQAITESMQPGKIKKEMEEIEARSKLHLASAYAQRLGGIADMIRAETETENGSAYRALTEEQQRSEIEKQNVYKSQSKHNKTLNEQDKYRLNNMKHNKNKKTSGGGSVSILGQNISWNLGKERY